MNVVAMKNMLDPLVLLKAIKRTWRDLVDPGSDNYLVRNHEKNHLVNCIKAHWASLANKSIVDFPYNTQCVLQHWLSYRKLGAERASFDLRNNL